MCCSSMCGSLMSQQKPFWMIGAGPFAPELFAPRLFHCRRTRRFELVAVFFVMPVPSPSSNCRKLHPCIHTHTHAHTHAHTHTHTHSHKHHKHTHIYTEVHTH